MQILKINLDCYNLNMQKTENFNTVYLINMEAEDDLFHEINTNGINPDFLMEIAFNCPVFIFFILQHIKDIKYKKGE